MRQHQSGQSRACDFLRASIFCGQLLFARFASKLARMAHRIAAATLFIVGTAIAAGPMIARLGWLMAAVGLIFGVAAGVASGVLWAVSNAKVSNPSLS